VVRGGAVLFLLLLRLLLLLLRSFHYPWVVYLSRCMCAVDYVVLWKYCVPGQMGEARGACGAQTERLVKNAQMLVSS
jgi:hypothetical protein